MLAEEVGARDHRGERADPLLERSPHVDRDLHIVEDRPRLRLVLDGEGDVLTGRGLGDRHAVGVTQVDAHEAHGLGADTVRSLPQQDFRQLVDARHVLVDHLRARAVRDHAPAVQEEGARTETGDGGHVVAHEEHGPPQPGHVVHLAQALSLERAVAHRQDLVDDQDLRLQVGGDREGEPRVHPAAVALDRRVEEALDLGEGDDLVELGVDLGLAHAEDGAVQEHVLAAGQLGMEAGADLEERAHAAQDLDAPFGGLRDAREDLQERALAGAVAPDDADRLAFAAPRTTRRAATTRSVPRRRASPAPQESARPLRQRLLQAVTRAPPSSDAIALRQVLDSDRHAAHGRGVCLTSPARRERGDASPGRHPSAVVWLRYATGSSPVRAQGARRPSPRVGPALSIDESAALGRSGHQP